jgi:hypothetical protein
MTVEGLQHSYLPLKELVEHKYKSYPLYERDWLEDFGCYYPGLAEVAEGMSKAKKDRRLRVRMVMECDDFFAPRDPSRAWGEVYVEVAEVLPEIDGRGFWSPARFHLGFFNPPCGSRYNDDPRYDPAWGASKLKEAADVLAKQGFLVESGPLPA